MRGKGGARSVHERSDGVMGVCVCAYVCVEEVFFFFLHTSCELFYAERKERQVKTTSDLVSCYRDLFFLLSILLVAPQ